MGTNGHYAYYPGCSLQHTAHAYDTSTRAVSKLLDLELREVEDWNCCGATEYFSLDSLPAYSLVARNLSLAAQQESAQLVAPCSACFLNLRKTDRHMNEHPKLHEQVNQALAAGGLHYDPGSVSIRHLLNVVVEDVGFERIASMVKKPLTGLRVAPYYGCLIARPDIDGNPEYPTHLDELLKVLGATVVDFPLKTHCCGGHMTQVSEDTAFELLRRLLHNASEYDADVIVTVCPMCQLNLDAYQPNVNKKFGTRFKLPVLYFTQMMAMAFGMQADDVAIGSEVTSAKSALSKIGRTLDLVPKKAAKKRNKKALPMPPAT